MSQRTDRVDELLRQEISALLAKEVADPRIGFVTVTDVETTPDLRHAKVWVSVIGTADERRTTIHALGRAMPFVRHALGTRLRIKRIPELHVQADETAERGTRVLRLLDELGAGADPSDLAAADPALPTPVARLPHDGDAAEEPPTPGAAAPGPPDRRRRRTGRPGPDRTRRGDAASPRRTAGRSRRRTTGHR